MAVANVDIQVDARSALQQLKAVNQQSQQLKGNADAATQSLKNQGATAQRIGTQFSGLAGAVGRLAVAYVGLRTAQEAVQAGIQREESSRRLQFLAKGYGEITAAQDAAARSGRTFGLSITESNQQFAQLYGRLRPLNVSLSDIEAAFVGFNTAAKASGATSEEASGALRQLSQALGSGALRGDELNSVLEQAPGLVVALTKELNAPISQIRKLAEEGKITSDVVIRALKRAGTEGADELAAAMDGPAQAVKNLQNEFENLQVAATKDLLPAIVEAIRGLRETLISLGPVIRGIGRIAAQTFSTISDLINVATKPRAFAAEQAIRGGRLPLAGLGGITGAGELFKGTSGAGGVGLTGIKAEAAQLAKLRRQPVTTVLLELMRNRLGRMDAASKPVRSEAEANALQQQLLGRQVGGGGGGGKGAADKAQRDRERAAEVAKQQQQAIAASQMQLSEARALYDIEGRILEARAAGNRELEVTRKAQTDLLRISFEAQLLQQNTELPAAQRKAQLDQLAVKAATISRQLEYDIIELGATRLDQIIQMAEGYSRNLTLTQQLTAEQQKQKDLADGIANTIGQGMASAFDGLIQGTENFGASLRKIASGVLIDIANQLLRVLVINQAINAISNLFGPKTGGFMPNVKFNPSAFNMPSLLPGRATGGSVTGGQPYLVGERGPELFMPSRSGGIAPTGSFGGDTTIVVNVDASGTKVQGNEPEGQALARIVAAAVNAELIKQKRPGGVLA